MADVAPPELPAPKKKIVLDLEFFGTPERAAPGRVHLLPADRWVDLEPGESIFEGARREGIEIPTTCGGKGSCWRCRIRFSSPAPEPTPVERLHVDRQDLRNGIRLACRCRPTSDVTVTVLPESSPPRG
jgi:ferredoxin